MEQTKTNTPPQWTEEISKWQKEDNEHRSVFCIATDMTDSYGILGGYSLPIVMALLSYVLRDENYDFIVKGVNLAKEDSGALKGLVETWLEFKKEHGWPTSEEEEKAKKSSLKSSLKDLFQTLADKL